MIYNLSEFNSSWNTRKLRSLGEFSRGKSKHRPRDDFALYEGGGYPFIQTGDIKAANLYIESHEQEYNDFGLAQGKIWEAGTLAITIAANIAETAILSYPMCFPDSVVGFTAYPNETTELYMYYIFAYIRDSIQRSVGGSIQDNINIDYLENLDFKIPDISIQNKIVNVLASLDQKIVLNNSINAELEKSAKLLYDYWFVQFDFPNAKGKPYRTSGGKMVYNEQLKREIPEGWEVDFLGNILGEIESGKREKGGAVLSGIPSIGAENIESFGSYDFNKEKYISENYFNSMKTGIVKSGDVLIYKDGAYTGKSSMALDDFPHSKCAINEHVFILRTNDKIPSQYFLYLFLQRTENYKQLNSLASAKAAQPGLNQEELGNFSIIVPQKEVIEQFNNIVKPIMYKIANLAKQSVALTQQRDFLLPLLMNGQVKVGE
jgi:type I restriction enzyme S subunit